MHASAFTEALKVSQGLEKEWGGEVAGKSGVTMHVSANRERDVRSMFMREERVGNRR